VYKQKQTDNTEVKPYLRHCRRSRQQYYCNRCSCYNHSDQQNYSRVLQPISP